MKTMFRKGQRIKAATTWAGIRAGDEYTIDAVKMVQFADGPAQMVRVNGEWIAGLVADVVAPAPMACVSCGTTKRVATDYFEPHGEPLCQGCAQDWNYSPSRLKR